MIIGLINFFTTLAETYGVYGIGLGMVFESIGVPFGGIAIALGAVPLVEQGKTTYLEIVVIATLGTIIGSLIAYYIGFFFGEAIRKFHHGHLVAREDILDRFVDSYGESAVFFAQLFGASRSFISLPAGIVRMNLKKFLIGTAAGSLLINVVMVVGSIYFYETWKEISEYWGVPMWASLVISFIFITCLAYIYKTRIKDFIVQNGNNKH